MNRGEIERRLPHRFPILLVDEVVEIVGGQRLVARRKINGDDPWYPQDRPGGGEPAAGYPSLLLVESWCQAAGLLATWDDIGPGGAPGPVMLISSISQVRIHRPVVAGTVVEHRVRQVRTFDQATVFEGETAVGGQVTLDVGRLVMTMRATGELRQVEGMGDPAGTGPLEGRR